MTIAPTLTLEQATRRLWDVVVVGAGPAGALAARELAGRPVAVLLVDKAGFPRWKVCGCCLNGRALQSLRTAGLGSVPERLGAVPLTRFEVSSGGQTASLLLPAGVALSRAAFDAALVEQAVDSGADFLPETQARLLKADDHSRALALDRRGSSAEVTARLVLAANGLANSLDAAPISSSSRSSRSGRVGAGLLVESPPDHYRRGTIYMACAAAGYVGLVRIEDDRLEVGAALDPAFIRGSGAGQAAASVLREAGLPPVREMTTGAWRGTPRLIHRPARVSSHRLFALGDAAGYVEPFTGEGISWALAAAVAVVPVVLRALRSWDPGIADDWARIHRRVVGRRQWLCRLLAAGLRRPALTRTATRLLAHAPVLAAPFIRHLNAPLVAATGQGT